MCSMVFLWSLSRFLAASTVGLSPSRAIASAVSMDDPISPARRRTSLRGLYAGPASGSSRGERRSSPTLGGSGDWMSRSRRLLWSEIYRWAWKKLGFTLTSSSFSWTTGCCLACSMERSFSSTTLMTLVTVLETMRRTFFLRLPMLLGELSREDSRISHCT